MRYWVFYNKKLIRPQIHIKPLRIFVTNSKKKECSLIIFNHKWNRRSNRSVYSVYNITNDFQFPYCLFTIKFSLLYLKRWQHILLDILFIFTRNPTIWKFRITLLRNIYLKQKFMFSRAAPEIVRNNGCSYS